MARQPYPDLSHSPRRCSTFGGQTTFEVAGTVAAGAAIWPGRARYPIRITGEFFARLLKHFASSEVAVGANFSDPASNSLGDFIRKNLPTRMNPAVYVAGLLIDEGYAEHVGRGRIRFFAERRFPPSHGSTGSESSEPFKRLLREKIEHLSEHEARQALQALNELLAESEERKLREMLAGDPAFVFPKETPARFEPYRPRPFTGKPLSETVIEDRR
jgi:hypothetical protein